LVSVFRQTSPAGHCHRLRHVSAKSRVDWLPFDRCSGHPGTSYGERANEAG